MLKLIIYALLCTVLLSCSKEDDNTVIPPAGTTKSTQLQLSFGGASTYATIAGSDAENKIQSVAFFVVTAGGEFSKYLSTETLNSERGLSAELSGSNGSYTTSLTIRANDLSGTSQIIVIANYAENELTDKLLAVNTLADLQNLQSNAIADNGTMPSLPLLMYASKGVNLTTVSSVAFNDADTKLKRMAARIDVIDSYETNTGGLFKLYSAQVINPKSATYLLPYNTTTNIAAIMPLVDFLPVTTVITTATDNRITLYTYECGESHLPTVQVVYQLIGTGEKFMRDFSITTKESVPIASIKRNSYYEVYSTPPSVFILDPEDWDEEDEDWVAIP